MKLVRPGHFAVCTVVAFAGWSSLATAAEYHGTVLTRATGKPLAGVVVQAYNLGTPAGLTPRILATTKTGAQGQFALGVTNLVKAKNVSLIVSAKGAKSEFTTVGGRPVVATSFERVMASVLHPSPKENIVLYALTPKSSHPPNPTPAPAPAH